MMERLQLPKLTSLSAVLRARFCFQGFSWFQGVSKSVMKGVGVETSCENGTY
jgi:hypothetical protein